MLTDTWLKKSGGTVLDHHGYTYAQRFNRQAATRGAGGAHLDYLYDSIGQLTYALAYDTGGIGIPRLNEKFGFAYDKAGNLKGRTLGALTQQFFADTRQYGWNGSSWGSPTNLIRYIYDRMLPIQERNGLNNQVLATYTRGLDLSGTFQGLPRERSRGGGSPGASFDHISRGGAVEPRDLSRGEGGIGGLLARTDASGNSAFYFGDAGGNITTLVNSAGIKQASYAYDPFGNLISISGPLAAANHYRFSSKEVDPLSGDYYFGFRFYAPNLQRWRNRDPIGLWGGWDPHVFVGNDPMNSVDPDGLWGIQFGSFNFGYGNPSYVFDRQVWGEIKEGWHNGLDAIGTLDPTPTADAINSLFYVGEGEYRDAALTAAGMLPYFGDSMKLLKRGEKLCIAAKDGERTAAENRAARNFFKNNKDKARQAWERRTGQKWPTEANGNPWPVEHTPSLKSGGNPYDSDSPRSKLARSA